MRYNRASVSNLRADLGNKQAVVLNENERDVVVLDKSPLMLSPLNFVKQNSFVGTPKTPQADEWLSESALESLPMDLLVMLDFPPYFAYCACFCIGRTHFHFHY